MKKKRLFIAIQKQFGYHSDTFYYCKYLKKHFDITYVCWDYRLKIIKMENVKTIYISRRGNLILRNLRFLKAVITEISTGHDIHFLKYFRGCALVKICFPFKTFLLDIRSGAVGKYPLNRFFYNLGIRVETLFFRHVSIISTGLANQLGIGKKAFVLPLGAETISPSVKAMDRMHLLYVGTLHQRNIEQVVAGFLKFQRKYSPIVEAKLTVIGTGYADEEKKLRKMVKDHQAEAVVTITGQIPHNNLHSFFATHNIGIAYIPKTAYFDAQPPTKTYEYLLSGMPVIATNTTANKMVITPENGILVQDSPESFCQGLILMHKTLKQYNSISIRMNAQSYNWVGITSRLKRKLQKIEAAG